MAPRVPKTVELEIFDILNESIDSGASLSDIQLHNLIRKAKSLSAPEHYVCLSALYSHGLKYVQAYENAICCMKSSAEQSCIENTVSALANARLFQKVVDISKEYPIVLEYNQSRHDCYESALYILDLEYCEIISSKYNLNQAADYFDHHRILDFFDNDKALVSRASEYFRYVLDCLIGVLADYSTRSSSLEFGLVHSGSDSSLELAICIKGQSFEQVFEMESKWHNKIACYEIIDDKLCDISFSMEVIS